MKYAWIHAPRDSDPIEVQRKRLGVSASGFSSWRDGRSRQRRLTDAQLLSLIGAINAESKGPCSSPRVFRELKDRGVPVSRDRVAHLFRIHDIRARHKSRYKATTDSKHHRPVAQNLLDRNLPPKRPDQIWTEDIICVHAAEGWLYLAVDMDLFRRMIVGWSIGAHMTRNLKIAVIRMTCFRRRPDPGLMHHSERGIQYASGDYRQIFGSYGIIVSMTRRGYSGDNAPIESIFKGMKNERTHSQRFSSQDEARRDPFEHIGMFYNQNRRHSALGHVSPAQRHAAWQLQQKMAA